MKILNKVVSVFTKIEGMISLAAIGIMFLIGAAEVLYRNLFGQSIYWQQEIIVILLVWEVFMGAAYIFGTSELISVDVLYGLFRGRGKAALDIFINVAVLIVLIVILRYGWTYMLMQASLTTTALRITQSIYTIPMLISALSMLLEIIRRFIAGLSGAGAKEGN